jgi:hypothetical protein
MTSRLERRIKNYRSVKIRDGQVVIEFKDPSLEEAISKKTSKHAEERSIKKYRLLKVKPGGGVIE